jgi:hypothetical protein
MDVAEKWGRKMINLRMFARAYLPKIISLKQNALKLMGTSAFVQFD